MNHLKWFGTFCFITAASLLSLNIDISKYGFILFFIGHLTFIYVFLRIKDKAMLFQNTFFIVLDLLGMYRWFN
jgi:uncharacterized membrane protein YhhN